MVPGQKFHLNDTTIISQSTFMSAEGTKSIKYPRYLHESVEETLLENLLIYHHDRRSMDETYQYLPAPQSRKVKMGDRNFCQTIRKIHQIATDLLLILRDDGH